MAETQPAWTEAGSQLFIELGRVYTPARDEIAEAMLDLIPADERDTFLAVEIGTGAGWLSRAVLERFPGAYVMGLDGSPTMLRATESALQPFEGRFEVMPFRLEDTRWRSDLRGVRCFVSSLVIHHLDGAGKVMLYRDLYDCLQPGGALLICDLVAPEGDREREYLGRAWDSVVRRQSLELTGSLEAYQQFLNDEWNWYRHPDPMDMPSTIREHLDWLDGTGFVDVTVFWQRAGHALYGGYKP